MTITRRKTKKFELILLSIMFLFSIIYTLCFVRDILQFDIILNEYFLLSIISLVAIILSIVFKRVNGFSALVLLIPLFRFFSAMVPPIEERHILIIALIWFGEVLALLATFSYLLKRVFSIKIISLVLLFILEAVYAFEFIYSIMYLNTEFDFYICCLCICGISFILTAALIFLIFYEYKVTKPKKKKEIPLKEAVKPSIIGNADAIKELKELLDLGIISQEEFDKKKNELLG